MRLQRIITMKTKVPRSPVRPVTCPPTPTWSSILDTITASDVTVKLATPNVCDDCHADKTTQWAAKAIERWHGPDRKGFQTYAEAFHAAWADERTPRHCFLRLHRIVALRDSHMQAL
jgi:hypothetical protein